MKRTSLVLAVFVVAIGRVAAGPVVVNGSFEAVQIGPPFVSHNLSDIPGWTHTGSLGDGPLWHIGYSDGGGTVTIAGDGNQFVTLGGGFDAIGSSSFDQVVSGFTAGKTYTLNFKIAAEGTVSGQQSLTVDFPSGSLTPAKTFSTNTPAVNYWPDWEPKTYDFVANSTSVDIRFSVTNIQFDVGLDSVGVSLATVPEPSTLTLLGVVAAGLIGRHWRRRFRVG
jgi:hypothetical protein